jgi:hypothetical protein
MTSNSGSYALSSSYALTASYAMNGGGSGGAAVTASATAIGGVKLSSTITDPMVYTTGSADVRFFNKLTGGTIVGATVISGSLDVSGSFKAITKSFLIAHPTKAGKQLEYGVVEGPEHTVFFRGRLKNSTIIELPDYWEKLVRPETITVQLTPVGSPQNLYVVDWGATWVQIASDKLFIDSQIDCFFYVQAERADIDKLVTEIG